MQKLYTWLWCHWHCRVKLSVSSTLRCQNVFCNFCHEKRQFHNIFITFSNQFFQYWIPYGSMIHDLNYFYVWIPDRTDSRESESLHFVWHCRARQVECVITFKDIIWLKESTWERSQTFEFYMYSTNISVKLKHYSKMFKLPIIVDPDVLV